MVFSAKGTLDEGRRVSFTFDIAMKLALGMKVLQTTKELACNDGDVLLSENAWFHLFCRLGRDCPVNTAKPTRSEQDPPEQYLKWRP